MRLDCSFWVNPSSPVSGSGFAVEWRYQFRGKGRVVLAYDGKTDRLSEEDEGATLDIDALHQRGNASLLLQKAQVHHSGLYICTVYLPYLAAQMTMELEIVGEGQSCKQFIKCKMELYPGKQTKKPLAVRIGLKAFKSDMFFVSLCSEPPSLSIHPSPLPLTVPGQILTVHCDASGFAPLSLELSWQYKDVNGKSRYLGSGSVTGHRQAWDGTYSQSSRLELDTSSVDLSRGGELTCVAEHLGGTRQASVTLNMLGNVVIMIFILRASTLTLVDDSGLTVSHRKLTKLFRYSALNN